MPKHVWKDEMYLKIHDLAKSGMSETKIAAALGVTMSTFLKWKKSKSAIRESLKQAGIKHGADEHESFRDYVYKRLPPHLAELWEDIMAVENAPNGLARVEKMLNNAGVRARQHLFVYALTSFNFNASRACRKLNVSRATFESWCHNDPDFLALIDEINWHKGNFFEDALVGLVQRGDASATIFANRTFNRDRGYSEKHEVIHKGGLTITHEQGPVKVADLNLPLQVRQQIFGAMKQQLALPVATTPTDVLEAEYGDADEN